ncbi:MAG: hypothetical protein IGR80_00200 [Synechococcales cyanobacterium K44_A2020_017]|nr:hypothetical protein [Synechococcales cyanobacterium K32_A2020_035]MBF2093162.1 hypothetical protein [Synechococcales cyanobacterium K44_A2020_017]
MLSKQFRSKTAALIALGMASAAIAPFSMAQRVLASEAHVQPFQTAQLFGQPAAVVVPAGTIIPVAYTEAERIVIAPDETYPVTLVTTVDVFSSAGTLVIPAGSQIEGELLPVEEGTQFVASEVVFANGTRRDIVASSDPITETEIISERSNPDILRGAAIGAAAAGVISEVFGSIDFLEVLGGAGLGALAAILIGGSDREVEVVVIEPEEDLDVVLDADFAL